ncbi:MAG: hypothetical protein IJE89_05640 [Bacilli bacterium]|nr:hypothetical protein [Bacilli bacterium]
MEEREKLLELLNSFLLENNIQKVYEIFKLLDQTDNLELKKENNLYLYLLSFIDEVPSEYINRVRSIKYEDLLINSDSCRYTEISVQNRIRMSIFRAKFHQTKEMIENTSKDDFVNGIERELILTLVRMANEKEIILRKRIEYLTKNKKYEELVSYLENRNRIRKLNLYEAYIYAITASIIRIMKTNKIPKVLDQNPDDIKKAIMGYNFQMALIFNRRDIALKYEDSKYVINLLLVEINKLIDNIIRDAKQKIEAEKSKITTILKKIDEELLKGNIEEATDRIKEYLKYINKENYLYLIENLIKVSILNNDSSYHETISFLNSMNSSNYQFDMKYFYSQFHNSINRNKLDIAEIYLNIIKHYQPEFKEDMTLEQLEKISSDLEHNKEELSYLMNELNVLKDGNEYMKIIKGIPQKRRKILIRLAGSIEELSVGSAGVKEPKNLVIRRINKELKTDNERKLIDDALKLYLSKEYNIALMIYLRLLTSMELANSKICEMIGLCYLHLNELDESLKYLRYSKQLQKKFLTNRFGIDKIIDLLEQEPNDGVKQKIDTLLTKYDDEVINFNIQKLEEIASYMKENNMTFEEGIEKFELVPMQVLIIKLIYAKYYYMEGMTLSADKLLQEVEKTKNKSQPVVTLLNEVREKKIFYQNQKDGYTRKR